MCFALDPQKLTLRHIERHAVRHSPPGEQLHLQGASASQPVLAGLPHTTRPSLMAAPRSRLACPQVVCRACCRALTKQPRRPFSSASSRADIYDVVCVGGGPAGLSLLTALRANPCTARLRLALVEAQDLAKTATFSPPPTVYSNRCSSLTPSSARFLDEIGAWAHLKRERVQEYHEMQVWDGVSGARIEFDWPPSSPSRTIAYMTENNNLTSALLQRLHSLGNVHVFDGAKVQTIKLGPETNEQNLNLDDWPVVHLANGKALVARLLVGADGANSLVRTFADIPSRGWEYQRHGVVATLQLEGDGWGGEHTKVAYQRFLPTGPVAMLPLPGNYATLVWSTTPEHASLLKQLQPDDLAAMIDAAFRLAPVDLSYMHTLDSGQAKELAWRAQHTPLPGGIQSIPQSVVAIQPGSVASFPLRLRHADTYIGQRVALVGDAAHTIHPLAGQGLNQGQADVESLARTINFAITHGQDLGTLLSLESYNSERYAQNHLLLGVCDKLHKLYSVESGLLVSLRSIGLGAVNAVSPLKNFIMQQASGTSL
ncbi:hypothetical protein CDD82_3868 [Ophiocordyceps australis]|uniref:Ubiquinone biosynthesis monooxygenase COQ6, mitochondrial n=1 Tax=Ophiocordyceps australis TaxID=1399860 RepID=A0A2C5Z9P5_9HYPO|nr:hypothetical protein CDD82_3868 [Ophiocordyceps australis]